MSSFIDKEVPHSAVSRSFEKKQWQTARRQDDEDDSGADHNDGSANNNQDIENKDGEFQQSTSSGLQKVISAEEKHVDGNDDDYDASDDKTGPGTENTDEKNKKRCLERQRKTGNKRKRQQDDSDGEDSQITATRSLGKGRKKNAVTKEQSDGNSPDIEAKKQGKRPWTEKERNAVKRRLTKFIALKKVPAKQDCLMCIAKESPALKARTWKDVKYFVYNEIVKIKRRLKF
ncbi:uncharacterized protein LOC141807087 [Halichoeres trimaculatus]|uniref:uncharacterized protein LOC141807087 n=1 Tax=Halichoeres trimaculatus TaxID=147232 RepID=UPI003D9E7B57